MISLFISFRSTVRITMKPHLFILNIFSCIALTKLQNNANLPEDLVDEYYMTTPVDTGTLSIQDEVDATDIWNSDRKEDVIASIIMYRDKPRRFEITRLILNKILPTDCNYETSSKLYDNYLISETHYVQYTKNSTYTFKDLVFGLTYHENNVLNEYLYNFFCNRDETWITIGMVLAKDMSTMTATYDKNHRSFASKRNDQRKPFKFMLRAWVRHPREPIEKDPLDLNSVSNDAKALKSEYEAGGWKKNRDKIEYVLMKKSIKYARAVIQEFQKLMALNKPMEDIIHDSIKEHDLNHDLADTYSSLTRYIKDKFTYIAKLLDQYSDGKDQWAAWIMSIAVVRPEEWPKIDEIFKKDHNGDSLSKFITQKLADNIIMAEMMAMAVDSNFKPTSFTKRPVSDNPDLPPPAPASATP